MGMEHISQKRLSTATGGTRVFGTGAAQPSQCTCNIPITSHMSLHISYGAPFFLMNEITGRSEYELILARVLTGKCKELGTECAPKLQVRCG